MDELTEVVTMAKFHPEHCNLLAYSSSRGLVKIVDTRESALCDRPSKVFEEPEDPASKTFFTEITASISDIT
jgi:serine/threonine-protein phosphatase 2A regulatory subunit B